MPPTASARSILGLAIALLAGCTFGGSGGNGTDIADASLDGGCTPWSFQPTHFDPCAIAASKGPFTIGAGEWGYDTDQGELTTPDGASVPGPASGFISQADGTNARVIVVDSLTVDGELRVTGPFPLIVAATDFISIAGGVDASVGGAGSHGASCPALDGADGGADGSGGGGGGGYGGMGAIGGDGNNGAASGGAAGSPIALATSVVAGCDGGTGGGTQAGAGGGGGGAVQLTAQRRIDVSGTLRAGGGGGQGGNGGGAANRSGGGGGGSGGYLGLEAPAIELAATAIVSANGGGGGGGCDSGIGDPGGDALLGEAPATGGTKEGGGGNGGFGAFGTTAALPGDTAGQGGGGGGGGVGIIALFDGGTLTLGSAVFSPPPLLP